MGGSSLLLEPHNRLSQCLDGLGFQDASGISFFRETQTVGQIDLAVAESQMILGRLLFAVMYVKNVSDGPDARG